MDYLIKKYRDELSCQRYIILFMAFYFFPPGLILKWHVNVASLDDDNVLQTKSLKIPEIHETTIRYQTALVQRAAASWLGVYKMTRG